MVETGNILKDTRKSEITKIARTTFKKNKAVVLTVPDFKAHNKPSIINVWTADFLHGAQATSGARTSECPLKKY